MLNQMFLILRKFGAFALMAYLLVLGWEHLGPRKPVVTSERRAVADAVLSDVVEDIRLNRGTIKRAVILHFGNDPTDYFTNSLRTRLEQRGTLDLDDHPFLNKVRNLLHLRIPDYPQLETAIERGKDVGASAVLCGRIENFESYPGGAKLDVEVSLVDLASGERVLFKRYQRDKSSTDLVIENLQETSKSFPWFQRLFAWAVLVLLLPVFTIGFIRSTVAKSSNRSNAFVLGVYTLADMLLAFMLVGAGLTSWFAVLVFLAAVGAALLYNIKVMTFAIRLEDA